MTDISTTPLETYIRAVYDPATAQQLLTEHRQHIRGQLAQEIEAAIQRNLAEYPDIPAMGARRLGLNHAVRIARADASLPQEA